MKASAGQMPVLDAIAVHSAIRSPLSAVRCPFCVLCDPRMRSANREPPASGERIAESGQRRSLRPRKTLSYLVNARDRLYFADQARTCGAVLAETSRWVQRCSWHGSDGVARDRVATDSRRRSSPLVKSATMTTRRRPLRYLRSDLKPARTSSEKSCGCSQAAKCPPFSTLL